MKYWILILSATFLLITAPDIRAHNLMAVNGKTQDHQHVYRRQQYGKPLQQGHRVQSAGGGGTIAWGSDARPADGKSTVRRSGPVIDDQKPGPGAKPNGSNKYGSAANRYGKAVQGYGKPVQNYGKPDRNE
jgi:hypothetical protein